MFVSRSKSVGRSSSSMAPVLAEGTEPSSPKVTCVGQVRIRKRNKNGDVAKRSPPKSVRSDASLRWRCLKRVLLCSFVSRRKKARRLYRVFSCCWWRKLEAAKDTREAAAAEAPPPIAFVREMKVESESESQSEGGEEETKVFVSSSAMSAATNSSSSPPKNALMLMRCRSAPHNRSSALALCRFPVSPIAASESEEEEKEEVGKGEKMEEKGRESCNGRLEEEDGRCSSTAQLAVLMRCKSEPAKQAEKLMEVSYMLNGSDEGVVKADQEAGPTPSPLPVLLH